MLERAERAAAVQAAHALAIILERGYYGPAGTKLGTRWIEYEVAVFEFQKESAVAVKVPLRGLEADLEDGFDGRVAMD